MLRSIKRAIHPLWAASSALTGLSNVAHKAGVRVSASSNESTIAATIVTEN
jgi:hypothetical protein